MRQFPAIAGGSCGQNEGRAAQPGSAVHWQMSSLPFGSCAAPIGARVRPPAANADRTSLALQGDPRPHPDLSDGSTIFDGRADSSASVATKSSINTNGTADYGQQTKRILYIMPNFHSVSAGSQFPPQPPKGKLLNATQDSLPE
jgi:hypothetical protein